MGGPQDRAFAGKPPVIAPVSAACRAWTDGHRHAPAPTLDLEPILAALDPEQRAAATLPDGPAQIIAPAGSGKTTTMVARLAVLLSRGVPAERICVVTFNRDAASGPRGSGRATPRPQVPDATSIEIRTLHALARQVLLDAGEGANLVADRLPLLRAARRRCTRRIGSVAAARGAAARHVAVGLEGRGSRAPPRTPAPCSRRTPPSSASRGALDFDDLVVRACELLETDARLRLRWQSRFSHVCVDEFQDVDAAQLRLVRLLAAPEDNLFVVGDDDQTIYAWRLADVRRILRFSADYPAARRVMLATNYRCPPAVVEASARHGRREPRALRQADPRARRRAPRSAAISAWSTADPSWPDGDGPARGRRGPRQAAASASCHARGAS